MNILCTNDDGIAAPGLAALEKACEGLAQVFTIAPDRQYSECSHCINTVQPFKAEELAPNRFALNGSPADCVRYALKCTGIKFDLVLSGINAGGNLGVDTLYSGTVAAAREARCFGLPSIAFSLVLQKDINPNWQISSKAARQIIENWIDGGDDTCFWNVNFPCSPDLSEAKTCELDPSPHLCEFEKSPDGFRYHHKNYLMRPRIKAHDVDLCFGGHTTLTQLKLF